MPILTICYCLINLPSYTFNLFESRCTVIAAKDLKLKELEHNAIKFSGQYTAGYDKMMLSDSRYQRMICFLILPCQFSFSLSCFLVIYAPCQQVKLSSCQARFQIYQVVNFINCHLVNLREHFVHSVSQICNCNGPEDNPILSYCSSPSSRVAICKA